MIPAGYLLKRTTPPPDWLKPTASSIGEICSISDCVNDNLVDLLECWQLNEFGLANSRTLLVDLARKADVSLKGSSLFYYEMYEFELDSDGWNFESEEWRTLKPSDLPVIKNDVSPPERADQSVKLGYDVVVYENFPDHSPLSCNSVAKYLPVNRFCLFDNFEEAKKAIDSGKFGGGCEDGLYRIMSVNRLQSWQA